MQHFSRPAFAYSNLVRADCLWRNNTCWFLIRQSVFASQYSMAADHDQYVHSNMYIFFFNYKKKTNTFIKFEMTFVCLHPALERTRRPGYPTEFLSSSLIHVTSPPVGWLFHPPVLSLSFLSSLHAPCSRWPASLWKWTLNRGALGSNPRCSDCDRLIRMKSSFPSFEALQLDDWATRMLIPKMNPRWMACLLIL